MKFLLAWSLYCLLSVSSAAFILSNVKPVLSPQKSSTGQALEKLSIP